MTQEQLLRVYAGAYKYRTADILIEYLAAVVLYSANSKPRTIRREAFISYLNDKFKRQKEQFLVNMLKISLIIETGSQKQYLLISPVSSEDFFISIESKNGLINEIAISRPQFVSAFCVKEVIFDGTARKEYLAASKYQYYGSYLIIQPTDNPQEVMDDIVKMRYGQEFCLVYNYDLDFTAALMKAGFLIMSRSGSSNIMPMHHLIRSVLDFSDLHINRSLKRFISKYELRADTDFNIIIEKCYAAYGDYWLTKKLIELIIKIKEKNYPDVKPVSFGVYRDGQLKAGEFGIISGKVYTSYSGYHEENHSGKVQLVLTAKYLRENGFAFWDFGMPLDYKTELGAKNITLPQFLAKFRSGIRRFI
ncbi:MAG: GNAT family N-acetyltransferase [Endomicrobium sp.]|jgi:Leu/Phe-tRNA-protein transferase|nr:GNAT family N-acetyltransferase [Endomicrobium sp.]